MTSGPYPYSTTMRSKFFAVFLAFLLAILLQVRFGYTPNAPFNFVLVALFVSAFFLDISQLLFLVSVGVLILNWQPALSFEIVLFAFLPFAVFTVKRFLPWRAWLSNLVTVLCGLLVFYASIHARLIFENLGAFLGAIFVSLFFGVVLFQALHSSYGSET
jgi:hypothetical protein